MGKVTIVREDNMVYLDGKPRQIDCSALPADVHAVQWDGAGGEVEYATMRCSACGGVSRKPNERISDLSPYQAFVDAWNALAAAEAQAQAAAVSGQMGNAA